VTSLKSLQFLKGKLETPYVVSYFFNSLLRGFEPEKERSRVKLRHAVNLRDSCQALCPPVSDPRESA
jgi:hypothetical protein